MKIHPWALFYILKCFIKMSKLVKITVFFFFSQNISVIHRRKKVMQVCDDVRVN